MSLAHSVFRDLHRTASALDFWHLEHLLVCLRADAEITGTILERVRDDRRQLGHDKPPATDAPHIASSCFGTFQNLPDEPAARPSEKPDAQSA
jgi:hypothetical protein